MTSIRHGPHELMLTKTQGRVFQSWVKITQVSAKFEFRFESLKSISVLILSVYKLMIGSSKNSRENYPFEHEKEKPGLNLTPG